MSYDFLFYLVFSILDGFNSDFAILKQYTHASYRLLYHFGGGEGAVVERT